MYRYGRINRATYWLGAGLFAAFYAAIYFATGKPVRIAEVIILLLAIPRLHDIGKSAWWAGGFVVAELVIAIGAFSTLPMNTALIVTGFFVILVGGLLIWLGLMHGQPEANQFGDPPAPGISYRSRRDASPADHF